MDLGITENKGQGNSSQSTELWHRQGLSLRQRVRALPFRPKSISALEWTKGCWSFLRENIYYSYFVSLNIFLKFIFGCAGSLLLHMGSLQLLRVRATLYLWCTGFSWRWPLYSSGCRRMGFRSCSMPAQQLQFAGSRVCGLSSCSFGALECRICICGTWAQLLRGIWNLPGPGIEPVSPALAGGFLSIVPPGKSITLFLIQRQHLYV